MGKKIITPPTTEPVELAQVKSHCRVDGNDDDSLLTMLIAVARASAEHRTGRQLITATYDLVLSAFPSGDAAIRVPVPPLQSVTSIAYIDTTGATQTLNASKYVVDTVSAPGRISPAYGESWPATRSDYNAVTIRFIAGYGANASAVPTPIKQWMLMQIATLYAQREMIAQGQPVNEIGRSLVDGLLDPYVILSA